MKAGSKPGSVHHPLWRWVIIYLGLALPQASSGSSFGSWPVWPSLLPRLAPSRGLPSQHLSMLLVRSYRTFAPLPVLRERIFKPLAVCFCGTILTVTRTGSYPASLAIVEPGLSSIELFKQQLKLPIQLRPPLLLSIP